MNNFICKTCDYKTAEKSNYTRHMASKKHSKKVSPVAEKVHSCAECTYTSKDKSNLNRHMKSHAGIVTYRFHCDACNMDLKDSYNLLQHKFSETHKDKVRTIYPELTKAHTMSNGVSLVRARLIITPAATSKYIKPIHKVVKLSKSEYKARTKIDEAEMVEEVVEEEEEIQSCH
jgi:hypothetical protein